MIVDEISCDIINIQEVNLDKIDEKYLFEICV